MTLTKTACSFFGLLATALFVVGCGNGAANLSGSPVTAQSQSGQSNTTTTANPGDELQIVAQGFTQLPPDELGNSYANEAAVLKWNGNDQVAEAVQVTLTLSNSAGAVVDSDEESVAAIFPGQTVAVTHSGQVSGASTIKVQASVGQTESYSANKVPPTFTTSGVMTSSPDGFNEQTVGTVTTDATKELQNTEAVAVYYNSAGAVIGGDFTFINFIPAGGSTSFSISGTNLIPGIARTVVYIAVSNLTLASLSGG